MATISTCAALSRIVPANFSLSTRNKAHKHSLNVALIQSGKLSSPIPFPQAKASRTAFEIMRTISEKDDAEIQSELNRLQNASEKFKEYLGEVILVLMAINPILQRIADAITAKSRFLRWSFIGASYGSMLMLKECVKILWKSQPIWVFIIVGFLIYKANMCNLALYRNGRYPVWLELALPVGLMVFRKAPNVMYFAFISLLQSSNRRSNR